VTIIVIPCYQGARTVGDVVRGARASGLPVVVVDDGSTDGSGAAAEAAGATVLRHPGNRGKGYSVRNGMLNANGSVLLFSDADLSSPIEEADKLFISIASGADVAIGSRWLQTELQTRRQPFYRQFFGRIFNLTLRIVLGLNFKDTQCGFKAFSRRAAEAIFPRQQIERWGFDPEILFLARRFSFKTVEVPVSWAHREGTRLSPFRDGIRMFGELLKIRWNSLTGKYKRKR